MKTARKNPADLNMLHFYEAISILEKLIKREEEIDLNRILQLHRYGGLDGFSFWPEHFKHEEQMQGGSDSLLTKLMLVNKMIKSFPIFG